MLSWSRCFMRKFASSASSASALVKRKRFYKKISLVSDQENGQSRYMVTLDGSILKTQGGSRLKIESEGLAHAIAEEWASQPEFLDLGRMRFTGLAFTATDNPNHLTRESVTSKILEYLTTDTILFYSPENEQLFKAQRAHWDQVIKEANADLGTNLEPIVDLFNFKTVKDEDLKKFEAWLLSYNFWALTGMQYAVEACKSVLLPLGLVRHRLTAPDAVRLGLLEQQVQSETWGTVEWAHGMEEEELASRLSAAALFVYFNSNHEQIRSTKVAGSP